jgi:multidrug transporter EmrE-like cation transporter
MSLQSIVLILVSVLLSASAQIMMKAGMSSPAVQHALLSEQTSSTIILTIAMSPLVLLGLVNFGFSAVAWLFVLSRIAVSQAYPFVALGIVATSVAGHFIFKEDLDIYRALGVGIVVIGVIVVGST